MSSPSKPVLTEEEKREKRRQQVREAQKRFREKHGLIKEKTPAEERERRRKEKAKERYKAKVGEKLRPEVPKTYNVDYQRQYHRDYYAKNKERIMERSRQHYEKKTE